MTITVYAYVCVHVNLANNISNQKSIAQYNSPNSHQHHHYHRRRQQHNHHFTCASLFTLFRFCSTVMQVVGDCSKNFYILIASLLSSGFFLSENECFEYIPQNYCFVSTHQYCVSLMIELGARTHTQAMQQL